MSDLQPGLGGIKYIVAVASGKGGVGKSTVTTNLAVALAKSGHKVGVMDGDLYGPSQPGMIGSNEAPKGHNGSILPIEKDGIKFISMASMNQSGGAVVMRAPLAIKAISQFLGGVVWGELDYLLIDLPPGTGDIQLTLAQQARLSGAIIVTTPQRVAVDIAKMGLEMFTSVNVPILGIVENMSGFVCPSCNETTHIFQSGGGQKLANDLGLAFLGGIPLDPQIMMSGDDGKPVLESAPESAPAKAFNELAGRLHDRVVSSEKMMNELEPTKINVYDQTPSALELFWKDNSTVKVDAYKLRLACPCASCVDENTGERLIKPESVSLDIRITGARGVGRYGVALTFSDGHGTGIYKFSKLKDMKPEQTPELSV